MTAIVTIGIDIAKNVFAVHRVNATGKPAFVRPNVPRAKLQEFIAELPLYLIGMKACSGAHRLAREFQKFGHTVCLIGSPRKTEKIYSDFSRSQVRYA